MRRSRWPRRLSGPVRRPSAVAVRHWIGVVGTRADQLLSRRCTISADDLVLGGSRCGPLGQVFLVLLRAPEGRGNEA